MFSCLVYAIIIPVLYIGYDYIIGSRIRIFAFSTFVLLLLPVLAGYFSGSVLSRHGEKIYDLFEIRNPIPKSWDYIFSKQEAFFILVTLYDDTKIGGIWYRGSYASSYPSDEDIYISIEYKVDEDGAFVEELPLTKGCWVNARNIKCFELFEIKSREGRNEIEQEQ